MSVILHHGMGHHIHGNYTMSLYLFNVVGFCMSEARTNTKFKKLAFRVYSEVLFGNAAIMLLLFYYKVLAHTESWRESASLLGIPLGSTNFLTPIIILMFHDYKIFDMVNLLDTLGNIEAATKRIRTINMLMAVVLFFMYATILGISIYAFIDGEVFLYESWYPIDVTTRMGHNIVVLHQMLGGLFMVTVSIAMTGFYTSSVILLSEHLRRLADLFRTVTDKEFRSVVMWHQKVLHCVEEFRKMLDKMMLAVLIFTIGSLGLSVFSFTMGSQLNLRQLRELVSVVVYLWIILVYSNYGTELQTDGFAIREALYQNDWHLFNVGMEAGVVLVLLRCGKPLNMTGGNFMPVNVRTMALLIEEALSYVTVMMSITATPEDAALASNMTALT